MDVYVKSEDSDCEEGSDVDSKENDASTSSCCHQRCLSTFDDQFKSRLKSDLSKLSKMEKRIFLFAMISINEDKKNDPTITKSSKYFNYSVREYGVSRTVCKTAFFVMHDTTHSLVRTLCKKMSQNYLIPTDHRGKHEQQPAINEETKKSIKTHFFNTLDSPTIFRCAKKRSGTPNISQLWLDFKKKHGHLSRSTYTKYISSFLTPEILSKFECANEAQLVLLEVNRYKNKIK